MNVELLNKELEDLRKELVHKLHKPKACEHVWVDTGFKLRWCKKEGCKAEQVLQNLEWVDVKVEV